jgi:hypothetical protein
MLGDFILFAMYYFRLLGEFAKFRKATVISFVCVCLSICLSVCLSVCPSAWEKSATAGRSVMKFCILGFLENLSRKLRIC